MLLCALKRLIGVFAHPEVYCTGHSRVLRVVWDASPVADKPKDSTQHCSISLEVVLKGARERSM